MSGWVAGAAVVGAGIGAYATMSAADAQANAAKDAANTSAGAQVYATDVQRQMFDKQVELQKPWQEAGVNALGKLTSGINSGQFGKSTPFSFTGADFNKFQDPGYAFRLAEGNRALDQSAAQRGGLISGNALKAAQRYGQEMGSQEFQNAYTRALTGYNANSVANDRAYNQLAGVANTGQVSSQQIGQAGQTTASNIGNLAMTNAANQGNSLMAAGNARASAYSGLGSSAGQALGGIGNYLRNYNSSGNWINQYDSTGAMPYAGGQGSVQGNSDYVYDL